MDPLNRMSTGRPGLSNQRLDGRPALDHASLSHRDLFERASVVKVGEGVQAPSATPKASPVVEFLGHCAKAVSRWFHKIFG